MRTLSAVESAALLSPTGYSVSFRVLVRDQSGAVVDLTDHLGQDWVQAVSVEHHVDDPVVGATITLHQAAHRLTLSPHVVGSRANQGGALLRANVPVSIETRVGPTDADDASPWRPLWAGFIAEVDAGGDVVTLTCSDLAKPLVDARLEVMRTYGAAPPTGEALESVLQRMIADAAGGLPFVAGRAYQVGDVVRAASPTHGFGYICTVAGTAAGSAPTWPTTLGASVVSGGATFVCARAYPTLHVPVSPLWDLATFDQGPASVWEAMQDLVAQIGWCLRYRHDDSAGEWRLTLYEPERSGAVPTWSLSPSQYEELGAMQDSDADVRNAVGVWYPDASDLDAKGDPKRKQVQRHDVASQLAWGRRWMELSEAAGSNIDTEAEAGRLADAALADLKEPVSGAHVSCGLLPHLELGDVVVLESNGTEHDQDFSAAITSVHHSLTAPDSEGRAEYRTELSLRVAGPVSMSRGWLQREALPGVAPSTPATGPAPLTGISVTPIIGGLSVGYAPPRETDNRARTRFHEAELHVSLTPGYTPSAATLMLVSATTPMEVTGLQPAVPYYVRLVARDAAGNRSEPSAEVTATVTAISGGDIGEGSIRQIHYLSPPTENLVPNGYSEAGAAAVGFDPEGNGLVEDPANAFEGRWCRRMDVYDEEIMVLARSVAVAPGDKLAAEARIKVTVPTTVSAPQLRIVWRDADGVQVGVSASPLEPFGTTYKTAKASGVCPSGAATADLEIRHDLIGVDPTTTVFADAIWMRRAVSFDLLEANTLRTSNYDEEPDPLNPGEMRAKAGAKLDNVGDAAMVAGDGLKVGSRRIGEPVFRALNALDGSADPSISRAFYKGNNDPLFRDGRPNIDRVGIIPWRRTYISAHDTSILEYRWHLGVNSDTEDNLDAMTYMLIELHSALLTGNVGNVIEGTFGTMHIPLADRRYAWPALTTDSRNWSYGNFHVIVPGNLTPYSDADGAVRRIHLRAQVMNCYGSSDSRWYTPGARGASMVRTNTAPYPGAPGGGAGSGVGGGAGGGYCVDEDAPVTTMGGVLRAADVPVGELVPGVVDGMPGMGRVYAKERVWSEDRLRVLLTDGRSLVVTSPHRFGSLDLSWTAARDLRPGDWIWGCPSGQVESVEPAPPGWVIRFSVESTESFVAWDVYNHNAKPL